MVRMKYNKYKIIGFLIGTCKRKKSYSKYTGYIKVIKCIFKGVLLRNYKCIFCKYYHVGHLSKRDKDAELNIQNMIKLSNFKLEV